jgi:hypothetical protein
VVEGKVQVKAHPGNDVMQNPSDPDATRDGHKGPGYQAQISETCSEENEARIVTTVLPETASEDDRNAMGEVLDELEEQKLLPEILFADTHYGSDESTQKCAEKGVDLQAPVSGAKPEADNPDALSVDDFVVDEATETVECCPAGHKPIHSEHDPETGKTHTEMPAETCRSCAHFGGCPVRQARGKYVLTHTGKARRLEERRAEQATAAFSRNYQIRGGIESTNSGMKRRTGLGRVRARGRPRVYHKIVMKVCGWNLLRAAATERMRRIVAEKMAEMVLSAPIRPIVALFHGSSRLLGRLGAFSQQDCPQGTAQAPSCAA